MAKLLATTMTSFAILVVSSCGIPQEDSDLKWSDPPFGIGGKKDGVPVDVVEDPADKILRAAAQFPDGTFNSGAGEQMLPLGKTAAEAEQGPKDGRDHFYDERDEYQEYAFTAPPDDVHYIPGEYELAQYMLIGWSQGASPLLTVFVDTIAAAVGHIDIYVYAESTQSRLQLAAELENAGIDPDDVNWVRAKLDSIWMRDYGPLVVVTNDNGRRIIDPRYYYGRFNDDVFPTLIADNWGVPVSRPPIETEGGNFLSDGWGNCIVADIVKRQNSHYGYSTSELKKIYTDYLGCKNTTILPSLVYEGTGHVDLFAAITAKDKVLVGEYLMSDDPENAPRLNTAAAQLQNTGFEVTRIPMPTNADGAFRSYTNSLVVNNVVLVPVYADDTRFEAEALQIYRDAFPSKTIVPIDSTQLIQWAGAIHCITMTIGY